MSFQSVFKILSIKIKPRERERDRKSIAQKSAFSNKSRKLTNFIKEKHHQKLL